jgi:dolichol kinase
MFICTFLLLVIALLFYSEPLATRTIAYLLCIAGVATVVEGITPLGLDNLSVPFVTALMYWFFLVG